MVVMVVVVVVVVVIFLFFGGIGDEKECDLFVNKLSDNDSQSFSLTFVMLI